MHMPADPWVLGSSPRRTTSTVVPDVTVMPDFATVTPDTATVTPDTATVTPDLIGGPCISEFTV
jgi:hypothetical protein